MDQIVGLHNHSYYSSLDGFCSPEEMTARAKDLGMSALSVTDHGTLSSHRHFQRACKADGIKPILGEELYFSETDRWDRRDKADRKDGTSVYVHLIALAMNDTGLKNLQTLDREAWLAYYYKPRMDWELLEQYNEGIIFTSACMGGLLAKAIEREDYDYAHDQAKRFKDLLGDRYYIEIQSHNPAELNDGLLELADYLDIKPVLAEDSHYASPEQKEMQEIFLILSTHPKQNREADISTAQKMQMLDRLNYLYPDRKMTFQHINLCIAGIEARQEEMLHQGVVRKDIYENTLEISDRIGTYTYLENETTLPSMFDDPGQVLREKVYVGLKKLGKENDPSYTARADHEIEIINAKEFQNYFLTIEDAMAWSKQQGIRSMVRGSGNGSLVCYALGMTSVDPLEYNLIFERFLDYERSDWPDVDWDIQDNRREEIKHYFAHKYGHVSGITNITRYKGKKALKDAARAIGVPFGTVNKVMKILNGIDEVPGHDVIKEFKDSKLAHAFNETYPDVVKIAESLHDRINGFGTHAAGMIVAAKPIAQYAPIETRKAADDSRVEVVGLDYRECESIGLIKIDLLGLKSLTVVDDTVKLIQKNKGIRVDLSALALDESGVYEMLGSGSTLGVFQCILPEQPIHTIYGMKPAGNIIEGDMVLTHNGRFMPVVKTMKRHSEGEMYELRLGKQNSNPIWLTGEHPVLISDHCGNTKWVQVKNIKCGRRKKNRLIKNWNSYVAVPKTAKQSECTFADISVDEELARFLGLYLAEGSTEKTGRICFTFNSNEIEYIDFVARIMKEKFAMSPKISARGNAVNVRGSNILYSSFFIDQFGSHAKNKIIPTFIYSASNDVIRAFLQGYAEGDGKIDESGHVAVQTASQNLAWGLKALSANLGCFTEVGHHTRRAFGGEFDVYTCSYHLGTKKINRVINTDKYVLIPIESVAPVDYNGPVVNFEVNEDNSYVSSIIMHNCEAAPYTKLLMKMGCSDFNDLIVSNALVRPGAWNAIGEDYIKAKKGKGKKFYIHDDVAYFMDETFHYAIFQEQMMKLSIDLAGFTVGEANGLRKGIGKKIPEVVAKYKDMFVAGATKKIDVKVAEKLWISFEEAGYYAFNKSHATSYALLSYQTAWLKYHYPLEFMCALLRNETNKDSVTDYLLECKNMGIKIKLPHINHSDTGFTIEGESLRMGLSGIKFISDKIASRIISSRPYSDYKTFKDHVLRKGSGLNTRVLAALNQFGGAAFDDHPVPEDYKDKLYEYLGIPAFDTNLITQRMKESLWPLEEYTDDETFLTLAMVKTVKRGDGWARIDLVDSSGSAGVFTDQNTEITKGKMYLLLVGNNRIMQAIDLDDLTPKDEVLLDFLRRPTLEEIPAGQYKVLAAQARKTKKNTNMAYLTVCDEDKTLKTLLVFDSQFNVVRHLCKIGAVRAFDLGTTKDGTLYVKGVH